MRKLFRSPSAAQRRLGAAFVALVIVAIPPLVSAVQQTDDTFENSFDGSWVGTIGSGKQHLLVQFNLNLDDRGGIAFAVLPDNLSGAPSTIGVFDGNVTSATQDRLKLSVDVQDPLLLRAATSKLTLDHDAATDTISGKGSRDLRGGIELVRMDPALPLQRLWSGSARIDGANEFLLLYLTQGPAPTRRFAAAAVGGRAWIGDRQGTIDGELNGNTLQATISLPDADLDLTLKLKKKNNLLKGTGQRAGVRIPLRLSPAAGTGKPMKFKSVESDTIVAGAATTVTLKGTNFSLGATAHSNNSGVAVTAVRFVSARALDVDLRADATLAAGASIALRVVNADGQVVEKTNALTVLDDGSGGGGQTVSFAADVQPIFTTNCALSGCHNAATAQAGQVLEQGVAIANIVNVPSTEQPALFRVNPGNADDSYLVRKIRGTPGITGGRMPLNRPPLSQAQIDTIVTWVNEGAVDDSGPQ